MEKALAELLSPQAASALLGGAIDPKILVGFEDDKCQIVIGHEFHIVSSSPIGQFQNCYKLLMQEHKTVMLNRNFIFVNDKSVKIGDTHTLTRVD